MTRKKRILTDLIRANLLDPRSPSRSFSVARSSVCHQKNRSRPQTRPIYIPPIEKRLLLNESDGFDKGIPAECVHYIAAAVQVAHIEF